MTERLASDDAALIASVKLGEGLVLRAYPDPLSPRGKQEALPPKQRAPGWSTLSGAPWTIGYGHTSGEVRDGLCWTKDQAEAALIADLANACEALDERLPWWRGLQLDAQRVQAEMCFNLGIGGLLGFHRFLAEMQAHRYGAAAVDMTQSLWARQVGARATRLHDRLAALDGSAGGADLTRKALEA